MNTNTIVTEVVDAFKQKGFEFIGQTSEGWLRLRGRLTLSELEKGCLCEVNLDSKFFELPRIRLLEFPPELPETVPHLGVDGDLCYVAKGTIVLDIFDPIGQCLACLERAEKILGQIIKGELVEDLAEEFFAYWGELFCMVDLQEEKLGRQSCIVAKVNGIHGWFVTDSEVRTTNKLKAIGYQITDMTVQTYRVKTNAQPRPHTKSWPPLTVGDILVWQGTLDPKCRKKINQRIREAKRNKANGVLIIIESPLITYGFAVLFDHKTRSQNADRTKDPIFNLEVKMVSVLRIDDRYLAQRNIPTFKTLAEKKIVVVGCGTIGGYLSELLVKAGAGTSGGELTLVDFDNLYPPNIGRHRLGFPDLFSNKSIAMTNELKRLSPGANVIALSVDVKEANLGDFDLLIDATGEEALGHWLCKQYATNAMLTVWIEGPGTAVRSLLRKNNLGACYRCLWHSNKKGELRSIVEPLPHVLAGQGCEGLYVPFPATVSLQAASLAMEMVLDWVNDINFPSLQTRLIDRRYQLDSPDCNPVPDLDCPICNL